MVKKICVVTGTRADFGIMSRLLEMIRDSREFELQVVATNMHLAPEYGMTVNEIEQSGFKVDRRVDMLLSGDSATATVKSMGVGMIGIADALADLRPDYLLILGDRYEMLSVASASIIFRIPVIHLHGGEVTEGAYDNAIRAAITQLSSIHFTSTEEYRNNVVRMGADPARAFNVGSLGVDNARTDELMTLEAFNQSLDFDFRPGFLLVTYHPATCHPGEEAKDTKQFLDALDRFPDQQILITMPNSDTGGREVARLMREYGERNPDCVKCVTSLGRLRYYTALSLCGAVVGNSSSGLIEAPSFGVPTLNVGDRQKGRAQGNTVVNSGSETEEIVAGLKKVLTPDFRIYCRQEGVNPYSQPNTALQILNHLRDICAIH